MQCFTFLLNCFYLVTNSASMKKNKGSQMRKRCQTNIKR